MSTKVSSSQPNSRIATKLFQKGSTLSSNFFAICFCLLTPSLITVALYVPRSDISLRFVFMVFITIQVINGFRGRDSGYDGNPKTRTIRRLLPATLTAIIGSSLMISNLLQVINTSGKLGMQLRDFFSLDFFSLCALISGVLAIWVFSFQFLVPPSYVLNVLCATGTSLSLMFTLLFLSPLFFYKFAPLFAAISVSAARIVLEVLLISADNLFCKTRDGGVSDVNEQVTKPPKAKDGTKEGKVRGLCTLIMGIFLLVSSMVLPVIVNASNHVMNGLLVFLLSALISVVVLSLTAAITHMVRVNVSFADIFNFSKYDVNNSIYSSSQEVTYGRTQYNSLGASVKEIGKNFVILAPQCKRRKYDVLTWTFLIEALIVLFWFLSYSFCFKNRWWVLVLSPFVSLITANALINFKLRPLISFFACVGIPFLGFDSNLFYSSFFFILLTIAELTSNASSASDSLINTRRTMLAATAASINMVATIASRQIIKYGLDEGNIWFSFAVYISGIIINILLAYSLYFTAVIKIKQTEDVVSFDSFATTNQMPGRSPTHVSEELLEKEKMCIIDIPVSERMAKLIRLTTGSRTKVTLTRYVFGGCSTVSSKPISDYGTYSPSISSNQGGNNSRNNYTPTGIESILSTSSSGSYTPSIVPGAGKLVPFRFHKVISAFILVALFSGLIQLPSSYPMGIVVDCIAYICIITVMNKYSEASGSSESSVYSTLIGGTTVYALMYSMAAYFSGISALKGITSALYVLLWIVLFLTIGLSMYIAIKAYKHEKGLIVSQFTGQNVSGMNFNSEMTAKLVQDNEVLQIRKKYIVNTIVESIILFIVTFAVMLTPLSELVTVATLYILGVDPSTMSAGVDIGTVLASVHMAFQGSAWKVGVWFIRVISGTSFGALSAWTVSKFMKNDSMKENINVKTLDISIANFIQSMDMLRESYLFIVIAGIFATFTYVPGFIANATGGNVSINTINAIYSTSYAMDFFFKNVMPLITAVVSYIIISLLNAFSLVVKRTKQIKNICLGIIYLLVIAFTVVVKENIASVVLIIFALFSLLLPTVILSFPLVLGGILIKSFERMNVTEAALGRNEAVSVYAIMLILLVLRINDISDNITSTIVTADVDQVNKVTLSADEVKRLNIIISPLYASFFRDCKGVSDDVYIDGAETITLNMEDRSPGSIFRVLKNILRILSFNMYIIAGFSVYMFTTWNFNSTSVILIGALFLVLPQISAEDFKLIAEKSGTSEMSKDYLLRVLPIQKGSGVMVFNERTASFILFRITVVISTLLCGRTIYESLYYLISLRSRYARLQESTAGLALSVYDLVLGLIIFVSNILIAVEGRKVSQGKSIFGQKAKAGLVLLILSSIFMGLAVLISKNSTVKIMGLIGLIYSIVITIRAPRTADEIRQSLVETV